MQPTLRKTTLDIDGVETDAVPPAQFWCDTTSTGAERLVVAFPTDGVTLLASLCGRLPAPLYILYVLHTPRGIGEPGRYQSQELDLEEVAAFLDRFRTYFTSDARADLWLYSPESGQTLVWDRHDLIYIEGPNLEGMRAVLEQNGLSSGAPWTWGPHFHNYRPECDADAKAVLDALDWYRTPLRPEDEQ